MLHDFVGHFDVDGDDELSIAVTDTDASPFLFEILQDPQYQSQHFEEDASHVAPCADYLKGGNPFASTPGAASLRFVATSSTAALGCRDAAPLPQRPDTIRLSDTETHAGSSAGDNLTVLPKPCVATCQYEAVLRQHAQSWALLSMIQFPMDGSLADDDDNDDDPAVMSIMENTLTEQQTGNDSARNPVVGDDGSVSVTEPERDRLGQMTLSSVCVPSPQPPQRRWTFGIHETSYDFAAADFSPMTVYDGCDDDDDAGNVDADRGLMRMDASAREPASAMVSSHFSAVAEAKRNQAAAASNGDALHTRAGSMNDNATTTQVCAPMSLARLCRLQQRRRRAAEQRLAALQQEHGAQLRKLYTQFLRHETAAARIVWRRTFSEAALSSSVWRTLSKFVR
jgi:hypothetical protein